MTNGIIVLGHTIRVQANARATARFGLQARPDMHTCRIEPDEEWLLLFHGAFHEFERRALEFLVNIFHALSCQRTRVLDSAVRV